MPKRTLTMEKLNRFASRAERQTGEWLLRSVGLTIGRYPTLDAAIEFGMKWDNTFDVPASIVHADDV